ncbi:MAG: VOC family protein [Bacteroidetes bacterium]|nr:VOC family protein [Bacteroidota bacterium]
MIKFVHTNIITDDWKKLSEFYIQVFDCKPLLPERDLNGDWLAKATNIKNAHLKGIHLLLPGYENPPTLEIFEYDKNEPNLKPLANRKGFGHIAFRVSNVNDVLNKVLNHGGSKLGEVVETNIPNVGKLTFVYAKDIDGNIIEIQSWQ